MNYTIPADNIGGYHSFLHTKDSMKDRIYRKSAIFRQLREMALYSQHRTIKSAGYFYSVSVSEAAEAISNCSSSICLSFFFASLI